MRKITIIILLLANFFVFITVSTAQTIDHQLFIKVHQAAPGMQPVSEFLSESAIPINLAVPISIASYGFIAGEKDFVKDAFYIAFSSGVTFLASETTKRIVRRERPRVSYPNAEEHVDPYRPYYSSFSFPSGHTSGCFSTATALSLKYPKWYVIAPAYLWATSVGVSRMHLGVHYPSDVLAGAVLGVSSAYLNYRLNRWFWKTYDVKGFRVVKL